MSYIPFSEKEGKFDDETLLIKHFSELLGNEIYNEMLPDENCFPCVDENGIYFLDTLKHFEFLAYKYEMYVCCHQFPLSQDEEVQFDVFNECILNFNGDHFQFNKMRKIPA